MLYIILMSAVGVVFVSLLGVLIALFFLRNFIKIRLQYLVSFSAGVFMVTAGALSLEVFHVIDSILYGAGLIIAGYVGAWLIHVLLPESHHHHDDSCSRHHRSAGKLLIGDSLHNITDGIILVPAFVTSPVLGFAVTVSIMIHETLQEVSKFFVLRSVGYSINKSLMLCVFSSSFIVFGALLGYVLLQTNTIEGLLLALSSGFLFHVVVHDLLPRRNQHIVCVNFCGSPLL